MQEETEKEEDRVYGERGCTHIREMTGAIPFIQHPRWALYCPTISSPRLVLYK